MVKANEKSLQFASLDFSVKVRIRGTGIYTFKIKIPDQTPGGGESKTRNIIRS